MAIDWKNHIHSNPEILMGKPIIKNTRISVELLLELFAGGWTNKEILESYPSLTTEDLQAVFLYLKDCIRQELYFPLNHSA